ncbi:WAT1-related protein At1g68170-like [Gastrolobium bilobum]|uniref:WAT1-related protein At1g68170-like n=1 Tax=Gastrolobium bilobum TaxID=150636 RepID=UPI002AAF6EDD|nr:WAT1-related protein At1g68170-like [Gastrolobium bilobum]
MKGIRNFLQGLKPAILMVFAQVAYAAVNVIYKIAIEDGMSMRVATAYRLVFASAFTILLALIFDRKKRPKITRRVLYMTFLCGLFGASAYLNLYLEALALTSATFVLAMLNLVPGITFIMGISSGFEKLNLGSGEGKAKVIGTITGISGAMLLTFFKGVEINLWSSKINLLHPHQNDNGHMATQHGDSGSKLWGVPCALASCCCFSLWFIIQAKLNEEFPYPHSSAALMSTMGAVQATIFALCVDRDMSQWKLDYGIRLLAVIYPGIVVSGIVVIVYNWCIKMRGPLFASIFNPLQLLLVVIAAYLMLDEKLYLGCVLGAVLIVCGLYAVLWGKGKEMKKKTHLVPFEITRESEAVQVVVTCTPVDHDKYVQSSLNQTNTTGKVADDH